jgi:pilus assembly protein CpaB
MEFRQVPVTNVQTTNAPVDSDGGEADVEQVSATQYVVTLALSPEQAERFVFAAEFGSVWLSLQPSAVTDDGTRPVTLGNVFAPVVR